jgi:hypothetical protein
MTISVMGVLAIALASSALTLGAAVAFYHAWISARLDAQLARIQAEFEQHVKRGVLAAGEELLPRFREQVALGFADVLKSSHAAGIAEGTAKIVAGSTDLLVDGLSNLFGLRKK